MKMKSACIRTEPVERDDLLLAVADGMKLRLLFPKSCITIVPKTESGKEVSIELGTEPTVKVTLQFDGSQSANIFHKYLSLWPNEVEAALAHLRFVPVSD